MKNLILFFLLGSLLSLLSCSSDNGSEDEIEQISTGTLEVVCVYANGDPIPDVTVSTSPVTSTQISDDFGKVVFDNIPVGVYDVTVTLPFNDISFEVLAEVKKDMKETIEVDVGFSPITANPPDLDLLLKVSYDRLKGDNLFDATGYSLYWGDIGMDIAYIMPNSQLSYESFDRYSFQSNNPVVNRVWSDHYIAIRDVNVGIDAILDNDFISEEGTDSVIAEAEFRFIRALLYFNLVKLFGNPVLVTTAKFDVDNPTSPVQDVDAVYDQIIEDLKFSQLNLSTGTPTNKASKNAATGLLGKVYLTMAGFPLSQTDKYSLALQEFEKIIGEYNLEEDYSTVFNPNNELENNEVIFRIDFEASGNYGVIWGPKGVSLNDALFLANGFVDAYTENGIGFSEPVTFPLDIKDMRFNQNVSFFSIQNDMSVNESSLSDWRPYKYQKENIDDVVVQDGESFDYIYLRFADVLLMIAEAENAINGPTAKAYDAVNQVRRRAFKNMDYDLSNGLNQTEFLEAILLERRLELCFEGQLKDDLIRNQMLESAIQEFNESHPQIVKDFQPHEYIWPIPISELNANPGVIQNPGY